MAVEGRFSSSKIDYDGEDSSYGFRTTVLTAANFDAQHTLRVALTGAVTGITLGNTMKTTESNVDVITSNAPNEPNAQREKKWLVVYSDDVTEQEYRIELPTADLTKLDPNDRKHAHIGDAGPVDAFVTAFEAYALSPLGNAVTVKEITFVGRNL